MFEHRGAERGFHHERVPGDDHGNAGAAPGRDSEAFERRINGAHSASSWRRARPGIKDTRRRRVSRNEGARRDGDMR